MISGGASLARDLGADSTDAISSLTLALEDEFQIEIQDADAEQLTTVNEVIAYLERRTAART